MTDHMTSNTYYFVRDHLGSVYAIIDDSGSIVESYEYDAWGKVAVFDGNGSEISESAVGNRHLFQGREYSWKTGLYYWRARWYNPISGRWISKDPIGVRGGLNQYVFVACNPVFYVDPTGLITVIFVDKDDPGGDKGEVDGEGMWEAAEQQTDYVYDITSEDIIKTTLHKLNQDGHVITDVYIYDHGNCTGQQFGEKGTRLSKENVQDISQYMSEEEATIHLMGCKVGKNKQNLIEIAEGAGGDVTVEGFTDKVYFPDGGEPYGSGSKRAYGSDGKRKSTSGR